MLPGIVDLVIARRQTRLCAVFCLVMVSVRIVKYFVSAIELGALTCSDVSQSSEDVERRLATAHGLRRLQRLVI